MALTKPILTKVPAWDVADGYTFTFNVLSGDQVVGNTLYISDNVTGSVVYSLNTTSYKYEAVVPANATGLQNGKYYNAYIVTQNAAGETSVASNIIQFYCYTKPTWHFTNVSQGGVIQNSYINAEVAYSQQQGERLNSYNITLYNTYQIQVASSGPQYVSSVVSSVSYTFAGLEDNKVYYIRATGQTGQGTALDTGFIRFTTQYIMPSAFSRFSLENHCQDGYISYFSFVSIIEGHTNMEHPVYIDNTKIDLRGDGDYVLYDDGFEVSGNLTLKAWIVDPVIDSTLISIENLKGQDIVVDYYEDEDNLGMVYFLMVVDGTYMIYTDSMPKPTSSQEVCIQIRRVNHIYDLIAEVI